MRKLSKVTLVIALFALFFATVFAPRIMAEPDLSLLSLELTANEGEHVAGVDTVTFTAKVENTSEQPAKKISLQATLDEMLEPSEEVQVSTEVEGLQEKINAQMSGSELSVSVDEATELAAGEAFTITFSGKLKEEAKDTITQEISLSYENVPEEVDSQTGSATAQAEVEVTPRPQAAIKATLATSESEYSQSSTVHYTLTLENSVAKSIAKNIHVSANLDASLTMKGKATQTSVPEGSQVSDTSEGKKLDFLIDQIINDAETKSVVLDFDVTFGQSAAPSIPLVCTVTVDGVDGSTEASVSFNVTGNSGGFTGDTKVLNETINKAVQALLSVLVSDDGNDVGNWNFWVTQSVYDELQTKITETRVVLGSASLTEEKVSEAKDALEAAITKFESAKKPGLLSSSGSVKPGYLDYDKVWQDIDKQADWKETSQLSDADATTAHQGNYVKSAAQDANGYTAYAVQSAQWTDKSKGDLQIDYYGAFVKTNQHDEAPIYCFTECTFAGYTFDICCDHIKNIVDLFGSCHVIAIMDAQGRHGDYTTTSTDINQIKNELSPYNNFQVGNHPNGWIYYYIKEYMFGSTSTKATKENLKKTPAAIFVNISDINASEGGPIADGYADKDFWSFMAKNYAGDSDWDRWYSVTDGVPGGSGTFNPYFNNIYGDAQNAVYRGLISPDYFDDGNVQVKADYGDLDPFQSYGINKPPDISFDGTLADFITINSVSGTVGGQSATTTYGDGDNPNYWECGVNSYTPGESFHVTVKAHVDPNQSTAGLKWFDLHEGNVRLLSLHTEKLSIGSTKLRQIADLGITKTLTPSATLDPKTQYSRFQMGDTIDYQIKVSNTGNGPTDKLVIHDVLPQGLSAKGTAESSSGTVVFDGNSWSLDLTDSPVRGGDSVTVSFPAIFDQHVENDILTNTAWITEANLDRKDASVSFKEIKPKLSITKTADVGTAILGDVVTYTIEVSNTGDAEARQVVVEDNIPTTLTSSSELTLADDATGSVESNHLLVNDEKLAPGATLTITTKATVNETSDYGIIENTATTTYAFANQPEEELKSSDTFEIVKPELGITKEIIHKSSVSGETDTPEDLAYAQTDDVVTYKIVVSNLTEKSLARDVSLKDVLPNGLDLDGQVVIDDVPSASELGEATSLGNIKYGTPVTITYPVTVSMGDENHTERLPMITNEVSVSAPKLDTKTATCDLNILYPTLEIDKVVDRELAQADDVLSYTVTITNPVEHTIAHEAHVEDIIPPELSATGDITIDDVPLDENYIWPNAFPSESPDVQVSYYQLNSSDKIFAPDDEVFALAEDVADTTPTIHFDNNCPLVPEHAISRPRPASEAYDIASGNSDAYVPCPVCAHMTKVSDSVTVSRYTLGEEEHAFGDKTVLYLEAGDGVTIKHLNKDCSAIVGEVSGKDTTYGIVASIPDNTPIGETTFTTCPECAALQVSTETVSVEDLLAQNPVAAFFDFLANIPSTIAETLSGEDESESEEPPAVGETDALHSVRLGDVAYGSPHVIKFSGVVINNPDCNEVKATATVHANHIDSATDEAATEIVHPTLQIKKSVDQAVAQADDTLTYTIEVTNPVEKSEAREVVLKDIVDENLDNVQFSFTNDTKPEGENPPESSEPKTLDDLRALVDEASSIVTDEYTSDSVSEFVAALEQARAVLESETQDEAIITETYETLRLAIDGLVKNSEPTLEMLETLVEDVEHLEGTKYTPDSWNNLSAALSEAKSLIDNPEKTPEEIKEVYDKLLTAENDLVELDEASPTAETEEDPAPQEGSLDNLSLGTIYGPGTVTITVTGVVKNVDGLETIPNSASVEGKYIDPVSSSVETTIVHPTLEIQKSVSQDLAQTNDVLDYEITITNPVTYSEARETKLIDVLSESLGRVSEIVVDRDTSAVEEEPLPQDPDTPDVPENPDNPDTPEQPQPEEVAYFQTPGFNHIYATTDDVDVYLAQGSSSTMQHLLPSCPVVANLDIQPTKMKFGDILKNIDTNAKDENGNPYTLCYYCSELSQVNLEDKTTKHTYTLSGRDGTFVPEDGTEVYFEFGPKVSHTNKDCEAIQSEDNFGIATCPFGQLADILAHGMVFAEQTERVDYTPCSVCAQLEDNETETTVAALREEQLGSTPAMARTGAVAVEEEPVGNSDFPEATLTEPVTEPSNLDLGTIKGGEVVRIRYKAQVLLSEEEQVSNTATVSAKYVEETSAETKTEIVYPSLLIEQTVDKPVAQTDDLLNYTVVVSNPIERSVARDVVLCETLPEGLEFMNDLAVDGEAVDAPLTEIPLGNISPDEPRTITFSATVTELTADSLTPVATAAGFNIAEVEAPVTTKLVYPMLTIKKSVSKEVVYPDDVLTYTVEIENTTADSEARNVNFKDIFPEGLKPEGEVKVSGLDGSPELSETETGYEGLLGNILAGKPVEITYDALVLDTDVKTLTNVASTYGDHIATVEAPITDEVAVNVGESSIAIEKTASVTDAQVGDDISYTLVVSNTGTGTVKDVSVKDELPDGGSYIKVDSVEGGDFNSEISGNTLTGTIAEIAPKQDVTIKYSVETEKVKAGDFVNNAEASFDGNEPVKASATVKLFVMQQTSGTQTGDTVTYLQDTGVLAVGIVLGVVGVVATGILLIKRNK